MDITTAAAVELSGPVAQDTIPTSFAMKLVFAN